MLRITILGTGYVGLVSGVCLSELGHRVICVDKDREKIKTLQDKRMPIHEDGLIHLLKKNVDSNRLSFSSDIEHSISESNVVMIAVGTPINEQGQCMLGYVNDCAAQIAKHASKDLIVIVKSTVSVGTGDNIQNYFDEASKFNCIVVSNPEFLREGNAVQDFMNPDRIIIGTDGRGMEIITRIYSKHIEKGIRIIYTDRKTAELIKYASNTFLAMKVGFINEIADFSQKASCNMQKVIEGIGCDKRIGCEFLKPGPGFGGSCFPKDVQALVTTAEALGIDTPIIKSVLKSNALRAGHIVKIIKNKICVGETIAILGLTYKANTDDTRDSPAISIIKLLLNDALYKVRVFDPCGMRNAEKLLHPRSVVYCGNVYEACEDASLAVILTEWNCFKEINPSDLKTIMKKPKIYDLRNIIDKEKFIQEGFHVRVVGYKANAKEQIHIS